MTTMRESLRREQAEREHDLCRRFGVVLCPGCGAAVLPQDEWCEDCWPALHAVDPAVDGAQP